MKAHLKSKLGPASMCDANYHAGCDGLSHHGHYGAHASPHAKKSTKGGGKGKQRGGSGMAHNSRSY